MLGWCEGWCLKKSAQGKGKTDGDQRSRAEIASFHLGLYRSRNVKSLAKDEEKKSNKPNISHKSISVTFLLLNLIIDYNKSLHTASAPFKIYFEVRDKLRLSTIIF